MMGCSGLVLELQEKPCEIMCWRRYIAACPGSIKSAFVWQGLRVRGTFILKCAPMMAMRGHGYVHVQPGAQSTHMSRSLCLVKSI